MSEVTFKVEGPLFEEETIKVGAKQALNDIGILGVGLVQKELVPGHGFLTGNLYRSISFALQGEDQVTIDSGKSKFERTWSMQTTSNGEAIGEAAAISECLKLHSRNSLAETLWAS